MKLSLTCPLLAATLFGACQTTTINKMGNAQAEIRRTEEEFEKMATEKGIATAFAHYADSSAVIMRGNDSLIKGKDAIRHYYSLADENRTTVNWEPLRIEVSKEGDMGYSHGNYLWQVTGEDGKITEYKGVYVTVWKRQDDGSWKFIWD